MLSRILKEPDEQFNVSFGYHCLVDHGLKCDSVKETITRKSSFSCLSGAALSANATLANTNIGNGLIGNEILPNLDSPKTFQRLSSSPSLSSLDVLSSSLKSSSWSHGEFSDIDAFSLKSMSASSERESFLNALEVQMAGGAAGEDRVQAVCSEENGWLFCAIYDGFNGRDAADFLAGTMYENVRLYLNILDSRMKDNKIISLNDLSLGNYLLSSKEDEKIHEVPDIGSSTTDSGSIHDQKEEMSSNLYRNGILACLENALSQAEKDFLFMVEQDMDDRPDLVSIGSCVLVALLHGQDLYILGLGDSRAILASSGGGNHDLKHLEAVQLTECHSVDNEIERNRLLSDHPDDPKTIVAGKVKGKLKLTRAFGVGYLKKKKLNDALMGILQVSDLQSPPYVSTQPSVCIHRITKDDRFVVLASDGLFDFLSNEEAVELVSSFMSNSPSGNPAKFLVEQLVNRAAERSGMNLDELLNIPAGMKRKYHDDVTVMVVHLGIDYRTTTASTHESMSV